MYKFELYMNEMSMKITRWIKKCLVVNYTIEWIKI